VATVQDFEAFAVVDVEVESQRELEVAQEVIADDC
jgi:hypothetical protein